MHRTLLKKSLFEARVLLAACAVALFVICWTRVWLVSQIDMSRFHAILDQFRDFERFAPVPFAQLLTYSGRIAITFDEPIVFVCVAVWAIARGSDCVSGEVGRGTMEMLLAQPVSRWQVLGSQAAVTVGGVAVLALATFWGVWAGLWTNSVKEPVPRPQWTVPGLGIKLSNPLAEQQVEDKPLHELVAARVFWPAAVNLFAMGYFLAGLTSLLSAGDRHRWRTIGVTVGFVIVQMLFKIISAAADSFRWVKYGTFFTAYEPEIAVSVAVNRPEQTWSLWLDDPSGRFHGLGPLGNVLLLVGLGTLAYAAAAWVFRRRDVPAPL